VSNHAAENQPGKYATFTRMSSIPILETHATVPAELTLSGTCLEIPGITKTIKAVKQAHRDQYPIHQQGTQPCNSTKATTS
jgi:hypothetical protein